MSRMRKWITCAVVFVILGCMFVFGASAAKGADDLAIDVVFVVDGSGSMRYSDPNAVAMEACKLFTDMCDYDQARAGYVVFSSKIDAVQNLTELSSENLRNSLKNAISSIKYPEKGGTDISLGLTEAMNMLVEQGGTAGDRSPMIILLSDGETRDVAANRVNIHEQELVQTLDYLSGHSIPVYTIALNYDNDAKVADLQNMSDSTGGLCFTTKTADELPSILTQILANQIRSNVNNIAEIESTGGEESVTINIPNDGIYQANIIILSSSGIKNIHLANPKGDELLIPSSSVLESNSKCYKVLKVINPAKGDWTLRFTGASGDHITVNLINSYDMKFLLTADQYTVTNGDTVKFTALCDSLADGETPSSVFDGAEGTITITNKLTGASETVDLAWVNNEMQTSKQFTEAGTYTVVGRLIGKDSSYDRPTDEIEVVVNPYPLAVAASTDETAKTVLSPFLGIPLFNKAEFDLHGVFSWDPAATVDIVATPGAWEENAAFDYDAANEKVIVTAKKSGNSEITLNVSDSFGQSVSYTIRVKAFPSWIIVLGTLLVIGLVVFLIIIIKRARRPILKGTLKVSTMLPMELASMTPPEAEIPLSVLNHKGRIGLDKLLASNLTTGGQYAQALSAISDFVSKVEFEAANADSSALWIYVPTADKTATVQFNNAPVDKSSKKSISANMPATLGYGSMGSQYTFVFSFVDENGFGGGDSWNLDNSGSFGGFGGGSNNGGGFGGFGGGNDAGGFGGFGDGNGAGGFGGFGGANDNSAGGFGGFGGGNDNSAGGFGGFGGGNDNNAGGFGGFGGGNDNNAGGFGGFGGGNNNGGGFGGF